MWGTAIIGFGGEALPVRVGSRRDTVAVGFSPRKAQTVLYLTGGLEDYEDLLVRLGQHQTGKGCLYLKRVDQAGTEALREIIARSYRAAAE